ncbi:MAG: alpha/beta fold hydrolase [Hyphomicrobiales bacterium]
MNQHDPIVGRYVYVQCQGKTYRTYYEECGEGVPMVCLHTAGTDGRQYRHQVCDPDYYNNFRMIAFDMPWHGKSLPPKDFYLMEDEYKLTTKFYAEFIVAFCHALDLKKPVIMGQSMGGNICLELALRYENEFSALIALEACDYSPGWWIDALHHPHIHGNEVVATSTFGLMSPESPDEHRWETWWLYANGGPGIFKGDLYFYSVDSDFREHTAKLSGRLPIYFITGTYDFACTPEMTERTAEKVKNSECIIFDGGHFPTSEDPAKFKQVVTPVLKKILALDLPDWRSGSPLSGATSNRPQAQIGSHGSSRTAPTSGRRVIDL